MKALPSIHPAAGLKVRFVEDDSGQLAALEMDIPRTQEILGDVHAALRVLGVEVTNIEVRADGERVTERLYISEPNGDPVSRARHRKIQDRVFEVFQLRLARPRAIPAETLHAAAG